MAERNKSTRTSHVDLSSSLANEDLSIVDPTSEKISKNKAMVLERA